MLKFRPDTTIAIEAGRVRYFVFFDFLFEPTRVHDGDGLIDWNGFKWTGVGTVLRYNLSSSGSVFSNPISGKGSGYRRGHVTASLPINSVTRQVLSKGYYRNRRMELYLCSYDQYGDIIESFQTYCGSIVKVSLERDFLTFSAEDDTFDSTGEKDERRLLVVEDFRRQFQDGELLGKALTSAGWLVNILSAFVGNFLGLAFNLLLSFRKSNRRALCQRWSARKRIFWFNCTPSVPRMWKWGKGYAIRADTLLEAKGKFYKKLVRRAWLFPSEWLLIIVIINGHFPPELFELDKIRQKLDPDRWRATSPLHK